MYDYPSSPDFTDNEMMDTGGGSNVSVFQIKQKAKRKRGRGFELANATTVQDERRQFYESLPGDRNFDEDGDDGLAPQRSIEGWILFVNNIHEEADEDHLMDSFRNYGSVRNLHLNLDRRTGFVKGYAILEYETYLEAVAAKEAMNGATLLGQQISVDWGFVKKANKISPRKPKRPKIWRQ